MMRFDPRANQALLDLRLAYRAAGPDADDMPDRVEYVPVTDEEGMVVRFRALSAVEVLDRLVADCRGEVDAT